MEHHEDFVAGDFVYIPPGVPHVPANPSRIEPAVVLLPELDDLIGPAS